MGLRERFGRWLAMQTLKSSGATALMIDKMLRQALGISLSHDQYPGTPDELEAALSGWVFAINRQLGGRASRAAVELVLRTRERGAAVRDTVVYDHPFLDLWAQPNEDESGMVFHWRWLDQINSIGRSYILVQPEVMRLTVGGTQFVMPKPARLTLLEPDRVRTVGQPFHRIDHYIYQPSTGNPLPPLYPAPATYAEREAWQRDPYPFVIRVVLPSGANANGASPVGAVGREVGVDAALSRMFSNQLKYGIHSQLVFYLLKDIEDPERFKKAVLMVKAGVGNAAEPMILPKKTVEVAEAPVSNSDMQYEKMGDHVRRRVLAALGASEALLGFTGDVNRATLEGLEKLVAIGTIDPLNGLLSAALNAYLLPLYRGQSQTAWMECRFASSAVPDELTQGAFLSTTTGGKQVMTQDEARAKLGLGPKGGAAGELAGGTELGSDFTKLVKTAVGGTPATNGAAPAEEDRGEKRNGKVPCPKRLGVSVGAKTADAVLPPGHPLATAAGRAQRWTEVDAERQRLEKAFAKEVAPVFEAWRAATEAQLLELGLGLTRQDADALDVEGWKARLREAFKAGAEAAILAALLRGLRELDLGEPDMFTLLEMRRALDEYSQEFAHHVAKTQVRLLRKALDAALLEGIEGEELARTVGSSFPEGPSDTRVIGMSVKEIGSMVGAGAFVAAATYARKKPHGGLAGMVWISQRDEAVRDSHQLADGQVIRVGGLFEVGDCQMHYPLDSASCPLPEEFMNCRCIAEAVVLQAGQVYDVDDDDDRAARGTGPLKRGLLDRMAGV